MGEDDFVTRAELREALSQQTQTISELIARQSEESRRLMEVLVERVESRVDLIAEGHQIQVEKLDRLTQTVAGHTRASGDLGTAVVALRTDVTEVRTGQDQLRSGIDTLQAGQTELRADMSREFKELRAQISLSYSEIDGRLRFLEHEVVDLRARMERLEAR